MKNPTILEMRQNVMRYQRLAKILESRYGPSIPDKLLHIHSNKTADIALELNPNILDTSTPAQGELCFEFSVREKPPTTPQCEQQTIEFVFDSDPDGFYKQFQKLKYFKTQYEEEGNLGGHPLAQMVSAVLVSIIDDVDTALQKVKSDSLGLVTALALSHM